MEERLQQMAVGEQEGVLVVVAQVLLEQVLLKTIPF
jgi:hypothetical protein